jgi:dolichyl-phosphate-mannose-protein mannosyltransferase
VCARLFDNASLLPARDQRRDAAVVTSMRARRKARPLAPLPRLSFSLETRLLFGICLLALALRLWPLGGFSTEYDEGVYWQSLRALADGHALFSSVFSSQPPFFLLSLYPLYLLFGQTLAAARLAIVVFSLAGIVAIYFAGAAIGGRWAGLAASLLLALDPLYITGSITLQAEVPSLTWALAAVALALHAPRASLRRGRLLAAASGVALGLGVLTKLWDVVAVVPVALYLAQPLLTHLFAADGKLRAAPRAELAAAARDAARLLVCCAGGVLAALGVVLLPFAASWPALYTQVVSFHLAAGHSTHEGFLHNFGFIWHYLRVDSLLILGAAALVLAALWRDWRAVPPLLWLTTSAVLLLTQHPLFEHHLVLLVPPLALFTGATLGSPVPLARPPVATRPSLDARARRTLGPALLGVGALALLWSSVVVVQAAARPVPQDVAQLAAALRAATVPGDLVVTDDQYVAGLADRTVPPALVDTSSVRITSGYLTAQQLEDAITRADARTVLFASGRFAQVPGFKQWVNANFTQIADFGSGRALYIRQPKIPVPA